MISLAANSDKKVNPEFLMSVTVTSDITNAEGNVTHFEYIRLFTQAIEGFMGHTFVIEAPFSVSIKYKKSIMPGRNAVVRLWRHKESYKGSVFFADFVDKESDTVCATGVLETVLCGQSALGGGEPSKAAKKQHKKLLDWREKKGETQACKAKFACTFPVEICFGRTSFTGKMGAFEYANIFGEIRERFGLKCIPGFKEEAGKEFILATNEASYNIVSNAQFGDNIKVCIWVEKFSNASFILRAEFFNKGHLCCVGMQRIGYVNPETGRLVKLSPKLHKIFTILSGYSRWGWFTRKFYLALIPLKFLWK